MTPEERIRAKVAKLKTAQTEREDMAVRNKFDWSIGSDQRDAFATEAGGYAFDDQGRAYHTQGDYKYTADELQRAMDVRNQDNAQAGMIFDQVLQRTGNPTMAADAVTAAAFSPFVGTTMSLEDGYRAASEIPDAYREGDILGMAAKAGEAGMAGVEAAATMIPFGKAAVRGIRNIPKTISEIPGVMRAAGEMSSNAVYGMEDLMAPKMPKPNNNALFNEVVKYLEAQGK